MANNVSTVSFGDYSSEQQDIERRRRMAEALQQQSMQPINNPMSGGYVTPISWTQGLAKMLQAYGGRKGMESATERQKALGERYTKNRASELSKALELGAGTPYVAEKVVGDPIYEGELTVPEQQAKAGDRQAMVRALAASQFPDLQQLGMAQMLKESETSPWAKIDPKDYTGDSVRKFAQTKNPADLVPVRKLEAITSAGANGTPQTEFINVYEPRNPIPQPIKNEFQNLGNVVQPVNPYAQTSPLNIGVSPNTTFSQDMENRRWATPSANTLTSNATTQRGQNMAVDPTLQGPVSQARATGTAIGQAQADLQIDPVRAAAHAKKILASINYDATGKTNDVSNLISGSTSGLLQNAVAQGYGAVTGTSTSGRKNIGELMTMANQLTMDLMGGKLGAGISNADRDFVLGQLGDVANANTAAPERLAAWNRAVSRLVSLAKGPATITPLPTVTPGRTRKYNPVTGKIE